MLEAEQRKKRLIELIKRLKTGGSVIKRDFRTALTDDEFEGYESTWESVQESDEYQRKTPDGLQDYLLLLRSADALTTRADAMHNKGNNLRALALNNDAQARYERAYENLKDALSTDPSLLMWLDRDFNFTTNEMPDLTAEDAPRLLSGRSCCTCQQSLAYDMSLNVTSV